jgi:methionyl aminopeptidase
MSGAPAPPPGLAQWRKAAKIAAGARELGLRLAVPGARRRDVAEQIEAFVREHGAEPAFPANLSRNDEAAHYTPDAADDLRLDAGDLLKVDVGAHLDGAVADTADTVEVGGGRRHAHLVAAVHDALAAGIRAVRPGGAVDDVSRAIAEAIHARGLKPVRDLTGHSIERYLLHAGKSIPNVPGLSSERFVEGEIVAIEPFATNGEGRIANGPFGHIVRFRRPPPADDAELGRLYGRFRTLPFTARWARSPGESAALERGRRLLQSYPVFLERGGGLVAQAEHTVRVGSAGAEVLTLSP